MYDNEYVNGNGGYKRITGCEKGVHTKDRNDYRSGTRQRRLDTRLGTFNLEVQKFRKSGYVPFFMKYKQRSELALISMIVEAYTKTKRQCVC